MINSQPAPRAAGFVAVLVIFTILAVFFVGLRLVARIVFLKNGGRDEVAIVCALVCHTPSQHYHRVYQKVMNQQC